MPGGRCRYCELIREHRPRYAVRAARHALGSSNPRCDLHWRFTCAVCGTARHFHAIAYCPEEGKFFCIGCAPERRAPRARFWAWSYYFRLRCPWHREWHPALDRLEFEGRHPWQTHPSWWRTRQGMDPSEDLGELWVSRTGPVARVTDAAVESGWDRAASWWVSRYTDRGDVNREWVIDPVLLRLLGPVHGLSILDAGCGAGYLSRILARRGVRVDGVDVSANLLAVAREEEARDPLGIRYRHTDLADLSAYGDETFDAAVANVVLQDVRRLGPAVREIHRVLKPGGAFAFSITHPAFEAPVPARWLREPPDTWRVEERRHLIVDRYFDRVAVYWGLPGKAPVPGFHRPLRDYFEALSDAGFVVTRFEEPLPGKEALRNHYHIFADMLRIPIFIVMVAVKLPVAAAASWLRGPPSRPQEEPDTDPGGRDDEADHDERRR